MNKTMMILLCWAFLVPATLAFGDNFTGGPLPGNPPIPHAYGPKIYHPNPPRAGHRIKNRLKRREKAALAYGRIGRAHRLTRRSEMLHVRWDRRGNRIDFRLHRRAKRIDCRLARW